MKHIVRLTSLLAVLLPVVLIAQVQNENLSNGIITARKKNAEMLQQYNWNSRTEILQDGKSQDIRIDLVNLGPDAKVQKSLLNDQPGQLPGGFLRKAIAENKRKELEEYISGLSKLVDQYTLPSAGGVIDFLAKAQVQPIATPDGKTLLQVHGNGVVVPGDTFAMSVDGRSLLPTGIQISTLYNGDPVDLSASFVAMKGGPNHVQFATVTVPSKSVSVMIHNYDYSNILQPAPVVVAPPPPPQGGLPIGSTLPVLPAGFRSLNVNGAQYYQSGPTWYQMRVGGSGVYFVVVPAP